MKYEKTIGGRSDESFFFVQFFSVSGARLHSMVKTNHFSQDCSNFAVADRYKQMHRLVSPDIYVRINLCSKLNSYQPQTLRKIFPGASLCGFATVHHSNICNIRPNRDVNVIYCPFLKGGECTDRQTAKMLHFCIFIPRLRNKYTYNKANRTIMDLHLTFFIRPWRNHFHGAQCFCVINPYWTQYILILIVQVRRGILKRKKYIKQSQNYRKQVKNVFKKNNLKRINFSWLKENTFMFLLNSCVHQHEV